MKKQIKDLGAVDGVWVREIIEGGSAAGKLQEIADSEKAELILTTGGTGFSERDVTPEATEEVIERKVPGIPEAIRAYSMTITKRAMLSVQLQEFEERH